MVIQCGCLDMMRAEDGKLHSQLEWPKQAILRTEVDFKTLIKNMICRIFCNAKYSCLFQRFKNLIFLTAIQYLCQTCGAHLLWQCIDMMTAADPLVLN